MEFVLGGVATCGACLFTNPLEVVKTRMQLQGELQAKGLYTVHYKNVFHAFYTIARNDGLVALQSGLVPAIWYQLFMNGVRLGVYQTLINWGFTKKLGKKDGQISTVRSVVAGAFAGCMGAIVGSPMYMVKTHLQAQAVKSIAVGYQHDHQGMFSALIKIYGEHGIFGLWRGVTGAISRVTVGSACQLSTFSLSKEFINNLQVFAPNSVLAALCASTLSGVVVVIFMTPFDVVSTRLYNQGVDTAGKGLYYSGFFDCFKKIFFNEGPLGFYKGWAASLFRLGPHTVLSLVFWDELRKLYTVLL